MKEETREKISKALEVYSRLTQGHDTEIRVTYAEDGRVLVGAGGLFGRGDTVEIAAERWLRRVIGDVSDRLRDGRNAHQLIYRAALNAEADARRDDGEADLERLLDGSMIVAEIPIPAWRGECGSAQLSYHNGEGWYFSLRGVKSKKASKPTEAVLEWLKMASDFAFGATNCAARALDALAQIAVAPGVAE